MKIGSKAICGLTVIPVRKDNDDRAEIVTQLLFGELIEIIDIQEQWLKIKIFHDQYFGWIDRKLVLPISEESFIALSKEDRRLQQSCSIVSPWGRIEVLEGSPLLNSELNFKIDNLNFEWLTTPSYNKTKDLSLLIKPYFNAPYLWGGRTKFGIDCSGFSQTIFHQLGVFIPRDSSQQALIGDDIEFKNSKFGDLAFFISEKTGNIIHVGIILADSKIIHAHGRVRIDILDEKGIYNEEEQYYSHKLALIKRHSIINKI